MNVLIVSPFFHPEICGSSRKMTHLAEDLVKMGHSVTVVTGFPSNPHYQLQGLARKGPSRLWLKRKHGDVQVIHTFTHIPIRHSVVERIIAATSFMLSAFFFIMLTPHRFDVLLAISPPFQPLLSAAIGGAFRRIPVICDIQDLYPDTPIQTGLVKNRAMIFVLRFIERFTYRHACALAMISHGFCEHAHKLGVPKSRLWLLHNWADERIFYPRPKDGALVERLGIKGKVSAIFLGTMGIAQGAMALIKTADKVRDITGLHFLFLGAGADKEKMVAESKRLGLENVSFLPLCPNEDVPRYLALADIGLVHLRNLPLFDITIPCKTFEYMAMGLPIAMSVGGEARKLVELTGAGLAADAEDPDDLATVIRRLCADPALRAQCSKAGRAAFLAHYTRSRSTAAYAHLLQTAIRSSCLRPWSSLHLTPQSEARPPATPAA